MAKPDHIELDDGTRIPILYEDRSALAIDKPLGWMLVPFTWQKTNWNLQAAIVSSIAAGRFWATSRGLKFLCNVHRLDAETTGILLFGKSRGAVDSLGDLFESRQMRKRYLAVVEGVPPNPEWTCTLNIGPDPRQLGRMRVDPEGKPAETQFRLLETKGNRSLIEALPATGRTHQIRVHLAAAKLPIVEDDLYGKPAPRAAAPGARPVKRGFSTLGLRAIGLSYLDPFSRRPVHIHAPSDVFVREFGFRPASVPRDEPSRPPREPRPPKPPQPSS